ncbi:maleylpyruvate isomerase N-terminal domain-containing protein [Streptomyces yanii]
MQVCSQQAGRGPGGIRGRGAQMDSIDGLKVLERAHTYLRAAVAGVPAGWWDAATPCDRWTVRQVLNHARLDQQAYAAAITGEGGPQSDRSWAVSRSESWLTGTPRTVLGVLVLRFRVPVGGAYPVCAPFQAGGIPTAWPCGCGHRRRGGPEPSLR